MNENSFGVHGRFISEEYYWAVPLMRWLLISHRLADNILPVAFLSLISVPIDVLADADLSSTPTVTAEEVSGSSGIRPDHLWTVDYFDLLWNDTESVITGPARWDQNYWLTVEFSAAGIGVAASLDEPIMNRMEAHRTASGNRFFSQYQNLGDTWSFGVIGAFEVWGEVDGDSTAKNTAMDALTASIIGPGLTGRSVKYLVGRVRPNTATSTFEFNPFSGNQSFPSGHTSQAFAVATAIAENYPNWWVQTLCYGGAGLVGYARIEKNAHYTSDVVAGALLGWSVARAVVHRHNSPPNPNKLSWTPYANGNGYGVVFSNRFEQSQPHDPALTP